GDHAGPDPWHCRGYRGCADCRKATEATVQATVMPACESCLYKIINGTAVDGRDFNIPATGEVIIPAGQTSTDMRIPTVYDGLYGASSLSYGIEITGTTTPITISNRSTSSLIESGNIPSDCSFTWEGG